LARNLSKVTNRLQAAMLAAKARDSVHLGANWPLPGRIATLSRSRRVAGVVLSVLAAGAAGADAAVSAVGASTAKRCRLTVARPARVGGAAGTGVISFSLVDMGNAACRVKEIPLVSVLSHTGDVLPASSSPGYTLTAYTGFVVAPGRSREFVATYVDHPNPMPASDCARAWYLGVLLPPPRNAHPLAVVPLDIPTTVCGDAVPYIYVWPRSKWPPA
jgi:hypothetical protein